MPANTKNPAAANPNSKTYELTITRTFAELGEQTKLTFRQSGFTSEGERDGHIGGWNCAFDKLDDYVATLDEGE